MNRALLILLRSPACRLVSSSLCELTYQAPSDGRVIHLPVQSVQYGDDLIVLAADAGAKRWWRAFNYPRPVRVRQRGRTWTGLARTIHPDHPASQPIRAAYENRHPVKVRTGDRIVLIDRLRYPATPTAPTRPSAMSHD